MNNKYTYEINASVDSVASRVLRLVGNDKKVLELGSSAGHMTKILRNQNCSVVSIDSDQEAVNVASAYAEHAFQANLDNIEPHLAEIASHGPYDVIVAADVLEHLKEPAKLLGVLIDYLKDSGYVVVSAPNVAYGGVIASLINGSFDYKDTGILDSTHLRFFTADSLCRLMESVNLNNYYFDKFDAGIDHPEFQRYWSVLPDDIKKYLIDRKYGLAYQFVLVATKKRFNNFVDVLWSDHLSLRSDLTQALLKVDKANSELYSMSQRCISYDQQLKLLNDQLVDMRNFIRPNFFRRAIVALLRKLKLR